jgi:hypothetical protein
MDPQLQWSERRVYNPTGPDTIERVLQYRDVTTNPPSWVDVPVSDDVDGVVEGRKGKGKPTEK